MNDREKLIKLLERYQKTLITYGVTASVAETATMRLADHLIANGVVIAVRCKECYKRCDPFKCPKCILADDGLWYESTTGNGYCDRGERK